MAKVLSYDELNSMRSSTIRISEEIDEALNDCKTVIDAFTNEEIVNSFFKSGKYGEAERERIEHVLNAIQEYSRIIRTGENNLYDQTISYIDRQLELVTSGTAEGVKATNENIEKIINSTPPGTIKVPGRATAGLKGPVPLATDQIKGNNPEILREILK